MVNDGLQKESLDKPEEGSLEKLFKECCVSDKLQRELKKDANAILKMDNGTLIDVFEDLVRRGAGPGFFKVIWMRREILRRMDKGDVQ